MDNLVDNQKNKKIKKGNSKIFFFFLRLQDINSHLHFGLAMSSKIANDIVFSLVKDYVIESTTLYVSIFCLSGALHVS